MNATKGWPVTGRFILLVMACSYGCASLDARVKEKSAHIISINQNDALPYDRSVSEQIRWGDRFTEYELAPDNLKTYSTATIKLLLESLNNVSFFTRGAQPYLSRQERAFNELARRGGVRPDDVEDLFQRYLAARLFDNARALKARFPDTKLWDLPDIIEGKNSPKQAFMVYDISSDSTTATVKHLQMETGPGIVIAARYNCSPATEALQYIQADKFMLQAMQAHGVIVTDRFEPGGVVHRNSEIHFARTYVAYTVRQWPGINFSVSPSFYFLKDGKVMHSIMGVGTAEEFSHEFSQGLAAIGLNKS